MPAPGAYLERSVLVAAPGATLEALYHRGAQRPALLLCPAPGPGGGMDAPALAELAWAAARAGHASLRFQYRGVGASTGTPDAAAAPEDAEAAFAHLAETAGPRLAIAALGGGAPVALALARAHPDVERVVLVDPAGAPAAPAAASVRVLVLLPEVGAALDAAAARALAGPEGRVEVVPAADPAWRGGLRALGRAAVAWLGARGGRAPGDAGQGSPPREYS